MLTPRRFVILLATLAMLLTACQSGEEVASGDGPANDALAEELDALQPDSVPGEQQPAVGGGVVQGDFGAIPVPTGARPTGGPATEDQVQTQSYEVTAATPQSLLDYYAEELPPLGWTGGPIEPLGDSSRAVYELDDTRLLIVASPDQRERDAELRLQISSTEVPLDVDAAS